MRLTASPLFERLAGCRSVLLAGAGGGFDIFAGLPLYFALKGTGAAVHLANLSFTNLAEVRGRQVAPHVVEVRSNTEGPEHYFPERALSRWFKTRGDEVPVYALDKVGGRPLAAAYRALEQELAVDAIVLVDGGTDLLMRGDEAGLGTPQEDITSLAACRGSAVPTKLAVCLGFGVDRFHGICHAHFLENVAALQQAGGFLGVTSLLPQMEEAQRFREAVSFAVGQMPRAPSIVALSVSSAIEGKYGDVQQTTRTAGSKLWVNPLMSLYWAFDLEAVAARCLYVDAVAKTQTAFQASAIIEAFHNGTQRRPWTDIPV